MDANTTVKIIAGVLCLILVAVLFLRKKGKKKTNEEEF
jgi:LPXTG-motif cell wall-anchored protein